MPFPNEHSARLLSPGISHIRVRRTKGSGEGKVQGVKIPVSISVIWYIVKSEGKEIPRAQALRFPKNKFTAAQAKSWLKEHKIKYISFEAAKKTDEIDAEIETNRTSWDTIDIIETMIKNSQVDIDSPWSFTAEDQNKILGENGDEWGAYASVHVGRNLDFERDNKNRYIYPVIKDGVVFKSALIQAKKQAKKDESWAFSMIDHLLGKIAEYEGMGHIDNTDISSSQTRVDFFPFTELEDDYMQEKFVKTDEGYLKGRAIITNVGVFSYLRPDGSVIRELRPPEEVFEQDSMRSLEMLPLTDKHPPVRPDRLPVDSENINDLQVGSVGDGIRRDEYHLSAPMTITNPDTIDGVDRDGHRSISCGYKVELEDKSGVWMGVPYDAIQRNIRYNHIAVNIDNGRAGDDVRIKMDEGQKFCDAYSVMDNKNYKEVNNMLKKIKIDDVEYDAEETVIKTLHDAQKKVDDLEKAKEQADKDHSELQAKHDSLKDENEQLKKDIEELKTKNPDEVKEAVKSRIALLDTAKRAGIEVTDDMKDIEIKKAIIIKAFPKDDEEAEKELKVKLDENDESYIKARFDAAIEYLEERGDIEKENNEAMADTGNPDNRESTNSDEARAKMKENLENAYKIKEEK